MPLETATARELSIALEASQAAIVNLRLDGTIIGWNRGAERLFGLNSAEVAGTSIHRIIPPDRFEEEDRIRAVIALGQTVEPYESVRLTGDNRTVHVLISATPIRNPAGDVIGINKCMQDITPLIEREREAGRQIRLHTALSNINRAIVEGLPPEEIPKIACQILVQDAGLDLAWIGKFDPDSKRILPLAIGGSPADYVHGLQVFGDDRDEGCGPTGRAFVNRQTQVSNDLLNDPTTRPWHARMKTARLHASAAVPIIAGDKVVGVLSVYARQVDFFKPAEISLLEDVARSIGLVVSSSESAEEARKARQVLGSEQEFSRVLIESTPGILCLCDKRLHGLRWSGNLPEVSGYSPAELDQMRFLDFFPISEHPKLRTAIESVFSTGYGSTETFLLTKSGNAVPYLLTGRRIWFNDVECLLGIGIDISARVAAEKARRMSEDRYHQLFDDAPLGILITDPEGKLLDANPTTCQMLGYGMGALTGKNNAEIICPQDRPRIAATVAEVQAGGTHRGVWHLLHQDGHKIHVNAIINRMDDGNFLVINSDITERLEQERKLARLDRTRRMIGSFHSTMLRGSKASDLLLDACQVIVSQPDFLVAAIIDMDPVTHRARITCMQQSKAMEAGAPDAAVTGIAGCDHLSLYAIRSGKSISDTHSSGVSRGGFDSSHAADQTSNIRSAAAIPLWTQGRAQHALLLLANRATTFDPEELDLLEWMASDLSFVIDHLETAERLKRLTYHDPLTGLLNANGIRDKIEDLRITAREQHRQMHVCAIDLENFSQFNERFGRESGDQLLRQISERLQRTAGEFATVARIGGDSFAMAGLTPEGDLDSCVKRFFSEAFSDPFDLNGHPVNVTFRAGVAGNAKATGTTNDILGLDHALRALNRARVLGKQVSFYSHDDDREETRSLSLETQLREALENDEFILFYQPRVDLISGEIVGAEALLRWQHPKHGLLPPSEFIELAERSGLIRELGAKVIQMVCMQQRDWRANGVPIVPVAANVSGVQINRSDLPSIVRKALTDNVLEPEWLELELTESAVMQDVARATRTLNALRDLGIKLSLDDFGTGYSSLSYLKRLPVDRVKIDRSFITDITHSVEDATIALAIIALARSLKLTSVAEGVETKAQLGFLTKNHCDEMQGYLFSPPVEPAIFASLLQAHRRLEPGQFESTNDHTILLVDDEQSICKALTRLLRRDGYKILTANSGDQALDLLAQHPVQVIVSDQRMPGMSGTELLDKVKTLYPGTIRVILSGYTDLNVITDSVNRGAVFRFLTKPWDDDELRTQIRGAFAHYDTVKGNSNPPSGTRVQQGQSGSVGT